MEYSLHHGDCLEVMAAMDAGSVDAVVTDPPYGLAFMGKHWDHGLPGVHFWQEASRVLKPSHYLLAFGGTRTWHRLACALEDAGFEIRDTLMWLYGSGFPKGKSCLKPAWEPIILARKPGPMRELGIEECRGGTTKDVPASISQAQSERCYGDWGVRRPDSDGYNQNIGRWPANLILDEVSAGMLDGQTGTLTSGVGAVKHKTGAGWRGNALGSESRQEGTPNVEYGDSGGASRFFYRVPSESSPCGDHVLCSECINREDCEYAELADVVAAYKAAPHDDFASSVTLESLRVRQSELASEARFLYCAKASRSERNAGCEGMEAGPPPASARSKPAEGRSDALGSPRQNHHPTVKPVALMRWLVRLVARPGDVVLDPFMGSGTTGVACADEGRDFIGIEREAEYLEIARRRIEAASAQLRLSV